MGKRREPPPEEGAPLWMCTYGDLMSLLLCFFVMLFAMSIITEVKYEALVETLQKDFGYQGSSRTKSQSTKTTTAISNTSERSRRTAALLGGLPIPAPQGEFSEVQTIRLTGEIVKGGLVRFELGNDELTEQAKKDLSVIFPVLYGSSNKIMIKGHVAPTEGGGMYKRDIDLAWSRAINVMDNLISLGLKQDHFEISVADSTSIPNRANLPPGTDPKLAGASVEVFLLDQTTRSLKEDQRDQWTTDVPAP